MKVRIEVRDDLEEEIIIRCKNLDANARKTQKYIESMPFTMPEITYYKEYSNEYYMPVENIMFFETDAETVFAHTADDAYRVKYRLYELENFLPREFIRVSKSTILNIRHIYSIDRNIASASLVEFSKSYKQVYVSRFYYKNLRQRLDERRNYEK